MHKGHDSQNKEGDTILDCDSDVVFESPEIALDMACSENEFKGWTGCPDRYCTYTDTAEGEQFFYTSGPCKSYSRALAEKVIHSDVATAIEKLMRSGFCPSEDCTTGFLLSRFGTVTNMKKTYGWRFSSHEVYIHRYGE